MRLADKLTLRCYHLQDYDWTPLNQNPRCVYSVGYKCMYKLCAGYRQADQLIAGMPYECVNSKYTIYNINVLELFVYYIFESGCCKFWK